MVLLRCPIRLSSQITCRNTSNEISCKKKLKSYNVLVRSSHRHRINLNRCTFVTVKHKIFYSSQMCASASNRMITKRTESNKNEKTWKRKEEKKNREFTRFKLRTSLFSSTAEIRFKYKPMVTSVNEVPVDLHTTIITYIKYTWNERARPHQAATSNEYEKKRIRKRNEK